jgi:thymidylate kinase
MRIIVDGPDGAGKTTVVEQLADHYECDIIHMTEKGSKAIKDYVAKANLDNIVSDRSFLSEDVYSRVFKRTSKITLSDTVELYKYYRKLGWKIIILDASPEVLATRLNLRGDEDEHKIQNIAKLRDKYLRIAHLLEIPVINTEVDTISDIINKLEEMNETH